VGSGLPLEEESAPASHAGWLFSFLAGRGTARWRPWRVPSRPA